jgi:surface antigen
MAKNHTFVVRPTPSRHAIPLINVSPMRNTGRSFRRVFLTRRIGIALLLGALLALSPVVHPEAVSAASGVDDYPARLKNAPQDSLVDPWLFYNRECTSWVAWRLNSENGVAFDNYWDGVHWGNASNWKNAAKAAGVPVDNNPVRGAVAWWSAGSAGSSRGHVAWVQVVGDGAITIEEYNYLREGYYDTRTISDTSSLWPSGFIHIKDTQLRNTASPSVAGSPQVGTRLVTTNGTWSSKHLTFRYQWMANGVPIAGATNKKFTPQADQLGQRISAKVTATKAGSHSGTAQSPTTTPVARGVFTSNTAPSVSGTPQVGVQLSASAGSWSPGNGTYTYQWLADGSPIADATASTFTPTATQLGARLRARLTITAPGYTTVHVSTDPTVAVAPGQFKASAPPTITGTPQVDHPLTATPGTWTPAGATRLQWLADGKPIEGATSTSYTPTPDVLHQQLAVQVRVSQKGYTDAVATSATTDPVAAGTFLNTTPPSVSGTAQVGVELKVDHGQWSPKATFSYQWQVDGVDVPGATDPTFMPRPQDVGKQVTAEVKASRPGYLTALLPAPKTAAVLPGVIRNKAVPTITGTPMVGRTLHASNGEWSRTPESYTYQWYAGTHSLPGATHATYHPTAADAGLTLHVVVTAHSQGYTPERAWSARTAPTTLGTISVTKPTVGGPMILGRTLTAVVKNAAPATATAHYQWYRGPDPIRGAHDSTYVLTSADVGHHVWVRVTMEAKNWVPVTKRSAPAARVRSVPVLHAHTHVRTDGRVTMRLNVDAPGLSAPAGVANVWLGKVLVGHFEVKDGIGTRLLRTLRHGTHTLTVVFRGDATQMTAGHATVTVTVP